MGDEQLRAIGEELRAHRRDAGWSGRVLARHAEVGQATVSRVENGRRAESAHTVERIIAALPVSTGVADDLRARVRDAYADSAEPRVDAGVSLVADTAYRLERGTLPVRSFQSAIVPRGLRTVEYAQAAGFGAVETSLLDDEERDVGFVVTEGALRTWPGDGSVMPDQLDQLVEFSKRTNMWLGVVPWSVPLPLAPPHGFAVFGAQAVTVETFTTQMTITDPADVAAYGDAFSQLERVAAVGEEARVLLGRIRRDSTKLPRLIQ
ncbi:transcriptional regulator with XRE-family HTH domain [Haloactinospora alba]|uniref:Transcriptional regulator with XRE-family HTH domain n=1 Tax=Haloactinospora alba TaxID=405555 RepID=A0A543NNR6_9ACTN|nr:Scr1 family TA system antitoxin-like transcriptional regulator [Haloactinospora alba]TQN33479.1 transcriptional regulator with XRE-family HTH domain [Haloactinospora alba]